MIVLRMVKGRRCTGCGSSRRTDLRTHLCTDCAGLAIEVADRKAKLDGTFRQRLAKKAAEVRLKLKEFNQMGRRAG